MLCLLQSYILDVSCFLVILVLSVFPVFTLDFTLWIWLCCACIFTWCLFLEYGWGKFDYPPSATFLFVPFTELYCNFADRASETAWDLLRSILLLWLGAVTPHVRFGFSHWHLSNFADKKGIAAACRVAHVGLKVPLEVGLCTSNLC